MLHLPAPARGAGLALVLALGLAGLQPAVASAAPLPLTAGEEVVAPDPGTPLEVAATPVPEEPATPYEGPVVQACAELTPPAVPGGPRPCAHPDQAPPGVDLSVVPSTPELHLRDGASQEAAVAAEESGVPTPAQYAADSTVPCDGDGSSGTRVQAVYVVAADRANRYAALRPDIARWAAGVEDVVNRSAAQTGGVRHVRFVAGAVGDGTCTPTVLQVTLAAGADASFSSTISAMQAQGFTDPSRKYLMWVDGSGYCGIAQMYNDGRHGQENVNNGTYPMFARVDAACWGGGYSVEAHELVHTLGGVQSTAPHRSAAGHCTDESDRMCYVDGSGVTMRQVCPAENEALLDCGNDDYFSTFPVAGTYLAGSWNTADSRFLVGGGNGTDGGTTGAPTRLAVGIAVDNPAVAGLPTRVTATPVDVEGRTPTVLWSTPRADCVFADPTAAQTTVTCSATSSTATTVKVTASDGVVTPVAVTSPMTFSTVLRTPAVATSVDGGGGAGAVTVCPGAAVPVEARVTDGGAPVKGVKVEFTRTLSGTTSVAASALTGDDGRALGRVTATAGTVLGARTARTGAFAVVAGPGSTVTPGPQCATAITSETSTDVVGTGEAVVVTGRLTRTVDGRTGGVLGERVQLVLVPTGSNTATLLTSALTTDLTGAFSLSGIPRSSGVLQVRHAATAPYGVSAGEPLPVAVHAWTTALDAELSATALAYKQALTVTGHLTRSWGGSTGPAASRPVVVRQYAASGAVLLTATATTAADGSWRAALLPVASGTVIASTAEAAGWSPSSTAGVPVTVSPWTTSLAVTQVGPTTVAYKGAVRVTGTVTRAYAGTSGPAPSVAVTLLLTPATGGPAVVVGKATSTSTGAFTATALPPVNGRLQAVVTGVAGYTDAAAVTTVDLTVAAQLTLTASVTSAAAGAPVTMKVALLPARASAEVVLQRQLAGGAWSTVATVPVSSTGVGQVVVPAGAAGTWGYRAVFAGDAGNAGVTSAVRTLRVV